MSAYGVLDDAEEVGMARWLAVAGERDNVEGGVIGSHLLKLALKALGYMLARRARRCGAPRRVVAHLAVDAVERANLSVARVDVHSERYAESAAVYRPDDWRWI